MAEKQNLLDVLLNPDNKDPITLQDENGKEIKFEQIANIRIEGDEHLYTILLPIDKMSGLEENEAIVFEVCPIDDFDDCVLKIVTDEDTANAVFDNYEKLLEDLTANNEKIQNLAQRCDSVMKKYEVAPKFNFEKIVQTLDGADEEDIKYFETKLEEIERSSELIDMIAENLSLKEENEKLKEKIRLLEEDMFSKN